MIPRPHWVVAAGGSLTIYKITAVNPDCSSLGRAAIHLLSAPMGGQVTLSAGREYLAFAPGNPRSACNRRKLPATEMIYHVSPGFAGIDRFSAEVIDPTGVAAHAAFRGGGAVAFQPADPTHRPSHPRCPGTLLGVSVARMNDAGGSLRPREREKARFGEAVTDEGSVQPRASAPRRLVFHNPHQSSRRPRRR